MKPDHRRQLDHARGDLTIRARLTTGLLNKAARGELALILPAGLVREAGGVSLSAFRPSPWVQVRSAGLSSRQDKKGHTAVWP